MTVLSRDGMEQRRIEAGKKLLEGIRPSRVAAIFGVSRATASRWNRAISTGGVESLKKRVAGGRPSRLTAAQKDQIANWVISGALVSAQGSGHCTTARLAQLVEERFGVRYNADYMRKLLLQVSPRLAADRTAGREHKQCHGAAL